MRFTFVGRTSLNNFKSGICVKFSILAERSFIRILGDYLIDKPERKIICFQIPKWGWLVFQLVLIIALILPDDQHPHHQWSSPTSWKIKKIITIIILVATYIKEALAGEFFAADGTKHLVRLSANLHFEIIRSVLVGH